MCDSVGKSQLDSTSSTGINVFKIRKITNLTSLWVHQQCWETCSIGMTEEALIIFILEDMLWEVNKQLIH